MLDLDHTLDQIELIDIYKTSHLAVAKYTLFSSTHGTFFRTDHMVDHKGSLSKF